MLILYFIDFAARTRDANSYPPPITHYDAKIHCIVLPLSAASAAARVGPLFSSQRAQVWRRLLGDAGLGLFSLGGKKIRVTMIILPKETKPPRFQVTHTHTKKTTHTTINLLFLHLFAIILSNRWTVGGRSVAGSRRRSRTLFHYYYTIIYYYLFLSSLYRGGPRFDHGLLFGAQRSNIRVTLTDLRRMD
jgi:hypothetical protein